MIVSRERRPASVGILCVEQKALSAFSDICAPEPERKHRIACRLQCRLRKGRERRPTPHGSRLRTSSADTSLKTTS